jgi:hypothetical protein
MAAKPQEGATVPPFPPLKWDGYFWRGTVCLGSWRGFQARLGAYGSESSEEPSDGTVGLCVAPPDGEARTPPSPEQGRTFEHLLANDEAIRDAVLAAIFAEYPGLRDDYGEPDEMPEIEGPHGLRDLIGPGTVHLLATPKDGLTCVGFELGCNWDEEHGLGVLTHRGRVLEVGGADASFGDRFAYEGDGPDEGG